MAKILRSAIPYKGPVSENLADFIRFGLKRHSQRVILMDSQSDRQWTGAMLEACIVRLANFLRNECKMQKGDVCTIYGEANDHFIIMILAVVSIGCVSNFVTNKYRPREVADTSLQCRSTFLITRKSMLENLKDQSWPSKKDTKVLYYDEVGEGYEKCFGPMRHLFEQRTDNDAASSSADGVSLEGVAKQIDPSQVAVVQFSSGTTGKPKPIPRTHKNLCHLVASVDHEELMDLKPGEVICGSLSITHRPGIWALLACINSGASMVVWDIGTDVEEVLRMIEKHRVTIFASSIALLAELGNVGVRKKQNYDLTCLRHVTTSGSKIVHEDLPKLIVKEFKLQTLKQCFGMTESGWVFLIESSLARVGHYLSVGHVVPGSEVAIMDRETMQPVGENVRGELAVRGPQVFPGYMTAEPSVLNRSDFLDGDWFRTGDQAYYDSQELVYIEGRYKELMIFSNRWQMFPNEIESLVSEHPAVESSCAVSVDQKDSLDIVRLFVTLKEGCKVSEKELMDFVCGLSHKVLLEGGIKIIDKLPRLKNGKVDKFALKELGR
jgi:acyl-coenzyme A synthetase/AMP-(fatty) acid ligase